MMEGREYDCSECLNRKTPLCEICTSIYHTDGTISKPKYFVKHTEISLDCVNSADHSEWLAQYIEAHVHSRTPVPLSIVMKYNLLTEEKPDVTT